MKREWVNCPVCGEPDMAKETDADLNAIITCTNHACVSNGGTNASGMFQLSDSSPTPLEPSLTPRDYFAGRAMQSLMVNVEFGAKLNRLFDSDNRVADAGDKKESPRDYLARLAYDMADAMLKASTL